MSNCNVSDVKCIITLIDRVKQMLLNNDISPKHFDRFMNCVSESLKDSENGYVKQSLHEWRLDIGIIFSVVLFDLNPSI